ncbi:NAD-dependent epimerase/dehydratase family protein [Streptomyces avermitilis]|uniref:NAD-dependent epimerase/dehydratase family protein n=1 Tax=Streptomyces avermitilis TaxID=33903 RepID=UPI0033B34F2D
MAQSAHRAAAPPPLGTPPRVVVLGGAGFLGRHLRTAFRGTGAEVISVSRPRLAGPDQDAPTRDRHLALDLATVRPQELAETLAGLAPDTVVNAAGAVWKTTDRHMRMANTELVTTLVDAVRKLPRRPRLIQLGTIHEYGAASAGAIGEAMPATPMNFYGESKLQATRTVLDAARAGELDGVVLRVANVIGPGAPADSLLGGIAARLNALGPGPDAVETELALAPLEALRDFVDVSDVAEAVLAAAHAASADVTGQVINVGSGRVVHVRQVVRRLIELSGLPVRLVEDGAGAAPRRQVNSLELDITKARRLLRWEPRRDLDESLSGLLTAAGSLGGRR